MTDRLKHLRSLLATQHLDAGLITSPSHLFYLTGYEGFSPIERDAYLLVTKKSAYLFTNPLHITGVREKVTDMTICEISMHKPLSSYLSELVKKHAIEILGIEDDNITVREYKKISRLFKKKLSLDLELLRIQKTDEEIHHIQKACTIGDKAFAYILNHIKQGMTEKGIALQLELFIREQGAELSFPTIVAFNANAAVPHHVTDETKLGEKGLILFDFGVKYKNYCSDMSRTVFLGEPTAEQKKVYETVKQAQQEAIDYLRSHLSYRGNREISHSVRDDIIEASKPDSIAREYIVSQGFPEYPHSLGHGIGIDVHEPPRLSPYEDIFLKDGMVFSIEPGIYLPGHCGVRIEDLIAMQNGKLVQLTNSSRELRIL